MNKIIDPRNQKIYSIFSKTGKYLLKNFINSYLNSSNMSGGALLLNDFLDNYEFIELENEHLFHPFYGFLDFKLYFRNILFFELPIKNKIISEVLFKLCKEIINLDNIVTLKLTNLCSSTIKNKNSDIFFIYGNFLADLKYTYKECSHNLVNLQKQADLKLIEFDNKLTKWKENKEKEEEFKKLKSKFKKKRYKNRKNKYVKMIKNINKL